MRVASFIAPDLVSARTQLAKAQPYADIIELRLDYWQTLDLSTIKTLRQEISKPVMFTLRTQSQGGHYSGDETQRLTLITELAQLQPDYLDLEAEVDISLVESLRALHPKTQFIRSYHNFTQTPENLDALFQHLYHPVFDLIKIATYANSIGDTLRLLIFLRQISRQHRVVGMAMGEYGEASRILAPVVGSEFIYGSVDAESTAAPGQLTLEDLTQIYRVEQLNDHTAIYALLGDPVAQSRGHILHNQAFRQCNRNAVYVKLKIAKADLSQAMALLRQLPFNGFSVTMPHKETIVPYVDQLSEDAQALGILNTIKRIDNRYAGFNTDSRAGVNLLAERFGSLHDQNILILGAGGSAKAIAFALLSAGAQVTLCNRTLQRVQDFNREHGGACISFAALFALEKFPFTAIINTLPADAYAEHCQNWEIPKPGSERPHIAMDIVYRFSRDLNQRTVTAFLQAAGRVGWECITGDKFFNEQARQQLKIWFE
jgi:3-dehydroquinate dehydratase / shikimate dehydrogenase